MNYLTAQFALMVARAPGDRADACSCTAPPVVWARPSTQLATALGARVIAVVSSDAKADVARAGGAHDAIPVDGFKDAVKELTGGRGVDLVVDPVGGDRFTDSLRSLAPLGRLLVIGFTAGEIPTVKVNRLLLNNIDVVGVGWGAFALARPGFVAEQWAELLPHLRSGALDPPIDATYPLDAPPRRSPASTSAACSGKVVLEI